MGAWEDRVDQMVYGMNAIREAKDFESVQGGIISMLRALRGSGGSEIDEAAEKFLSNIASKVTDG